MEEETSNIPADMATSLEALSLSQLLDLAIGAPERGTVHFLAIRKLLEVVLVHLNVQYLTTQEPWTGQLGGPSLADMASGMEQMKKEIQNYKKKSKGHQDDIGGIKAENSRMAEDIKNMQEAQAMAAAKHLQETESLKTAQRRLIEDMKKIQSSRDEDMAAVQDVRDEIDKIKAQLALIEEEIKKIKDALALMKKLEEDIKKLRAETAKWKEEINKEISQKFEAMQQETKRELKKMEEQQELRNAMLQQMVAETANQLNEQDEELAQQMEAKFAQIQRDYEKLSFASGSLQKDSQQKQKAIEMLFQSLEKLQKEKADEQDMLAAIDVKADKAALGSKVDSSQFEENMEQLGSKPGEAA
ncbi:PREDICTED: glutamine-rich protein 2-like [Ficedula albicollis]|uniref:glutamine-rich protein 2-like n=1 Tax=Ficedula albicollis TaxID=59894 RepID=UPI0007AD7AE8|nr:PREDICTED: glutamine-rich protein 2-like [Ficedula albicollis]